MAEVKTVKVSIEINTDGNLSVSTNMGALATVHILATAQKLVTEKEIERVVEEQSLKAMEEEVEKKGE